MFRCGSFLDRSATTGCTTTLSGTPTASISFSTASLILRQSNLNRHLHHNLVNLFCAESALLTVLESRQTLDLIFSSVCAFVVHFLSCSLSSAQQQLGNNLFKSNFLALLCLVVVVVNCWLVVNC